MFQNTAHIKKITYIHSVGYADSADISLRGRNRIIILLGAGKVIIPHRVFIRFEHLRDRWSLDDRHPSINDRRARARRSLAEAA